MTKGVGWGVTGSLVGVGDGLDECQMYGWECGEHQIENNMELRHHHDTNMKTE